MASAIGRDTMDARKRGMSPALGLCIWESDWRIWGDFFSKVMESWDLKDGRIKLGEGNGKVVWV